MILNPKSILLLITLNLSLMASGQKDKKVKYQQINSTNYFDAINYNGLLSRLESIKPNAERKWGHMTVSQMLHHLNLAIGSGLGYYILPDESNVISRGFNQFMILNVLKRFPIETQTSKPLMVTDEFDFETEKKLLKEILVKAYHSKTDEEWGKHTYFGKMNREAWGKLIMIHCNHHFQQFSN